MGMTDEDFEKLPPIDNSPEISSEKPPEKPKRGRPKKDNVIEISTPTPDVNDDEANMVLDLLTPVCTTAAKRIYNVSDAVADAAFQFTPEHRRKINPPLVRVLNKWLPLLIRKYADEIGLGIVLFSVINAQVKVMRMLDATEKAQQRKTPPPPPTEIPTSKAGD
jgi:hypothetical protein